MNQTVESSACYVYHITFINSNLLYKLKTIWPEIYFRESEDLQISRFWYKKDDLYFYYHCFMFFTMPICTGRLISRDWFVVINRDR